MTFNHFKKVLHDLFKKQRDCDVTFSCDDPKSSTGESKIMAHKFILSIASDVFHTMFYGEAAKQEKKSLGKIMIDDIKMPTFKLFLSFIYANLVDFETIELAAEFYYAAHKYNAIDALEYVNTYMLKEAKPWNAIELYSIACLYENQELKDACTKIFSENTMEILNSPIFLKADPKIVETIYKLDSLNISSEMELVRALERYIEHNKANNSDIAEKVRPALSHIRFLTLAAPDIATMTLLNSEDSLAVIGYIVSGAAISKIPKFLSSNNKKRAFTISAMEMIRKLSTVFSDKYCNSCVSQKKESNHAYWSCPSLPTHTNQKLREIYQKYNHVWLLDYNLADLKAVYEVYRSRNLLN